MKLPCFSAPPLTEFRTVYANQHVSSGEPGVAVVDAHKHYSDNVVITSKYKIWNFIPKNLFEQLRRIANFYFVCIVIVQFSILDRTPVSPATSLLPLVFVIFVTAVKQGFEDWKRHKADKEVNLRPAIILKDGLEKNVYSKDIKVGDIVKVENNDEIPCDIVVISSSEEEGECHIMTANLDGETNLKTKRCLAETNSIKKVDDLCNLAATIECDHPEYDMYKFNGRLILQEGQYSNTHSLSLINLLLRGSKLKNTEYVYGVAVYTGDDTKMALNQKEKSGKFSTVEKSMNRYLLVFLLLLLIITITCTVLKSKWEDKNRKTWYLLQPPKMDFVEVIVNIFSFLILFNYIIPISLYVTVEVQKFCGAQFINWDIEMYHQETDDPAVANTSDLNEELGQIEYIFTDKTGTLTENDMVFRRCSIGGVKFIEIEDKLFKDEAGEDSPLGKHNLTDEVKEFFIALALCHTVQADELPYDDTDALNLSAIPTKVYSYQASSPDEKALCEAAARFGVVFKGKVGEYFEIDVSGKHERYRILHILEFDPTRKRMSVIVESPKSEILMFCKGAESHVAPRCNPENKEITMDHIDGYAEIGLRTLTITSRKLTRKQYEHINEELINAQEAINDRESKLAKVFDEVEHDFNLLGATAVEDKLQENVKDTMESLKEAGIKIWVLTGDKRETAVNISYSCGHFKHGMGILDITNGHSPDDVRDLVDRCSKKLMDDPDNEYALVIDGASLLIVLESQREDFLRIGERCSAVLCCRMSPLQKAQIVRIVKKSKRRPITLAIGDGANDCSMIQEAHVGCGIMGKEGRQAVRCSDYAFHRFYYLKRMLLVHGHNFYSRLANTVQYFFYKNITFIFPQFLFQFWNGYSTQPLYSSVFLTCFNIFFVSLPVLFYGIFEQDIDDGILLDKPILYKDIAKNEILSWKKFLHWSLSGLWHGLVIFLATKELYGLSSFSKEFLDYGFFTYGTFVFTLVVIVANLKLAMITHFWTWFMHFFMWGSIFFYIIFVLVYCGFTWPWPWIKDLFDMDLDLDLYMIIYMLFQSSMFWFASILIIALALLPDLILTVLCKYFDPTNTQKVQVSEYDCREMFNNKVGDCLVEDNVSMKSVSGQFEKDNIQLL